MAGAEALAELSG
jgi:hypothetical protein